MEVQRTHWHGDVMDGFEARAVAGATLVRPVDQPAHAALAVLHVHGNNDYFFQRHLAHAITGAGHAFYAVDLARAGRSLRPGELPHYMDDARDQGVGIAAAVTALHHATGLPVVIHAHSTGALTATLWAHAEGHPALAGLALNSPLFGLMASRPARLVRSAALAMLKGRPMTVLRARPSPYARRLHVSSGGEWEFNTEWKRPAGVPVRAGWLAAVDRGIHRVRAGLTIEVPVLVARSDTCGPDRDDNTRAANQDVVVDVHAIARAAPGLGERVTLITIEGGIHDLSLSPEPARERYLDALRSWLVTVAV